MPGNVGEARPDRSVEAVWRRSVIEGEGRVDRGVVYPSREAALPELRLPDHDLLLEPVRVWDVVDPEAEPSLLSFGVRVKDLSEVVNRVERAPLVGNDVGIGEDKSAAYAELVEEVRLPGRKSARVATQPDDFVRAVGQILEQRRVGRVVVEEVDPVLPGPLQIVDQLNE